MKTNSKFTSGAKTDKKHTKFRAKQILIVGLIALVLSAGYYRWTLGAIKNDAVSVSGTATPSTEETSETFWTKEDKEDKEDNNKQDESQQQESKETSSNIISSSKQDRDKLRGETMDKWKEISSNKDASESAKKEAEENTVKLTKYSENENAIETGIKSKGYSDCFAQVSDSGVSVIVKADNLDSGAVAQIKDIIIAETGVAASQIKISSEK